jgi:putative transposase
VFLDATYVKARVDSRVVSRAVVIATGVTADGGREVLGCEVGDSEDGAFWTAFLRSLKARGLTGVQLVISDAHTGLKQAIAAVLAGACWQRCRVHFLRNALARVPKASAEMVAVTIRTSFAQLPRPRSPTRSTRSPPPSSQGFRPWRRCWSRPRRT